MAVEVGKISVMKLLRFVLAVGLGAVAFVAVLVAFEGRGDGGGSDAGERLIVSDVVVVGDSGDEALILADAAEGVDSEQDVEVLAEVAVREVPVEAEEVQDADPVVPFWETESFLAAAALREAEDAEAALRVAASTDSEYIYPILEHAVGGLFYFKIPWGYSVHFSRNTYVRRELPFVGSLSIDLRYPSMTGIWAERQRLMAAYMEDPENNRRDVPLEESIYISLRTVPPPRNPLPS